MHQSNVKKATRSMKIGILTFHKSINYGSVLQIWALQETIRLSNYTSTEKRKEMLRIITSDSVLSTLLLAGNNVREWIYGVSIIIKCLV